MNEFDIRKPDTSKAELIECKDNGYEEMDPIGYFLIRINKGRLEAGLCDYENVNVVKKVWIGDKPQDVYRQITEDIQEIMKDHVGYLAKELTRAWICMKLDVKFVQDGKMDGTFPEVEWIVKK